MTALLWCNVLSQKKIQLRLSSVNLTPFRLSYQLNTCMAVAVFHPQKKTFENVISQWKKTFSYLLDPRSLIIIFIIKKIFIFRASTVKVTLWENQTKVFQFWKNWFITKVTIAQNIAANKISSCLQLQRETTELRWLTISNKNFHYVT